MARQIASDHEDFPEDDDIDVVSKSQLKRDMDALQSLGEQLVELNRDQLKKLALPETLMVAVLEAKRLTANGAIRRQRQYIGKLMRNVDPVPIQAFLDSLRGDNDRQTAYLHMLERTRDELLANDTAIARLIEAYPDIDIQALRTTVRNARTEKAASKPPKHFRALFQILKDLIPAPALPTGSVEPDILPDSNSED